MAPGRQVLAPAIFLTRWVQVCAALTARIVCRMVYASALQTVLLDPMTTTPEYGDVRVQILPGKMRHVDLLFPCPTKSLRGCVILPAQPGQCESDMLRYRSGKDGRPVPGAHRREPCQQYSWSFVDNLTSILQHAIRHTHFCFHEFWSFLHLGSDSARD
ncbi:MAG: hypothetical protein Q9171_001389 [Xanthocarpia ochracea]